MKIKIVAVGNLKEKYFCDAFAEYAKRISRFCKLETKEVAECLCKGVPSAGEIAHIVEKEGKAILAECEGYVVALDIDGKAFSSEELSAKICNLKQTHSIFTFVIGGSYGLSQEVKDFASLRISFGKITLPHQLCRVVLCEQVYRLLTIENNVPYHK